MRILHVNNQASVAYMLSRYQRELGHRSDLLAIPLLHQKEPDIKAASVGDLFLKLLIKAPGYDLIHVHGGIGISGIPLTLYKILGKRFICHYHGSELRGNFQTSFHFIAETLLVSTPDLLRYSRNVGNRELIHIPNPVELEGVEPVDWDSRPEYGKIRIVHLPTVRKVKGTQNIVESLKGLDVELEIIENTSRSQAMKKLREATICIDWMSNDYDIHGLVSLEAMARGIPTICNISPDLYPDDIPIIRSRPEQLRDVVKGLIKERNFKEIGRRSRDYVMRYHHPSKVARMLEDYI